MNSDCPTPARKIPAYAAGQVWGRRLRRFTLADSLVLAAILVSIVLRFVSLDSIPPALNQDEAVNGYDAYSLSLTGRDHHGHPFPFAGLEGFGDWASPLLTFLTVPAVGVFGLRVEVVRAVAAALGVLAVPVVYLLSIELFRRQWLGVLAAWFIAISPWHVHRSRFAIPTAMVPTMVALTMLMIVWTMRRCSSRGLVVVAITAALTIASYPTMKLYVPLMLLAAFLIYARTIVRLNREALCYAMAVFLAIAGPIFFLSLADPGGRARLEQVSVFNTQPVSAAVLLRQYMSYFSPRVLFITGNGHPAQTPTPPGHGVEPRAIIPFFLAGLLWLIITAVQPSRHVGRQSALFLLSALVLYPVPGSLTQPGPHLGRGAQLIPVFALIAATGAVAIADSLRRWLHTSPAAAASCVFALTVIMASALGLELSSRYRDYFNGYANRENVLNYFQYGLEQALRYVRVHETEYDEIWITDTNQPYIYVLFYDRWPPSEVHRSLNVQRNPPKFNEVEAIGKYRFGDPPSVKPDELALLYSVQDPVGRTVYEVHGGETTDRGRILLVSKPLSALHQAQLRTDEKNIQRH